MALEVRYIPMKDEGDRNFPKIMRVVYQDGVAIAHSVAPFTEAETGDPSCVEAYFDLLRDYFIELSQFFDAQRVFSNDVSMKMFEIMAFCSDYMQSSPIKFTDDVKPAS